MVTIRLLGEAGRLFGRRFELAVKTPAEAIRALCVQIPALRQYLLESEEKGICWRAITEHPEGLDEDQLLWPMSKRFILAPQPVGKGGVGKIVLGVALVALSFVSFGAGAWAGVLGSYGVGSFAAAGSVAALVAGAGLITLGVADLLTPTPTMPTVGGGAGGFNRSGATSGRSREEQQRAYTFDKSNANTQQGEVVPVLYGERIIGSLPVLSFGLELQNSL
jgi:predicted phage tail protein